MTTGQKIALDKLQNVERMTALREEATAPLINAIRRRTGRALAHDKDEADDECPTIDDRP